MPRSYLVGDPSAAATDLGLGSTLRSQVAGETEEQRRKRLQMEAMKRAGLQGPVASSAAANALFGARGGSLLL